MSLARRTVAVALIVLTVMALVTIPAVALAGVRTRVFVGVGPFWWDPFWPYPYYPYGPPYWAYPPPYYAYAPPPVVVEEPPVYVQREPLPSGYWYYCASPGSPGYYPTVPTCPEAWIRVPPRPAE